MPILGRMLPKKSPGNRVIGLTHMICRIWSLSREPLIREWASAGQPDWEAAIAGNSALREPHLRALDEELFTKMKASHGHGLSDIQSFYDEME
eukprot:1671381-Pyramimonas_sp.AAC.1